MDDIAGYREVWLEPPDDEPEKSTDDIEQKWLDDYECHVWETMGDLAMKELNKVFLAIALEKPVTQEMQTDLIKELIYAVNKSRDDYISKTA